MGGFLKIRVDMVFKVVILISVILVNLIGTQNLIGNLNAYINRNGYNNKRVKEPKILSLMIFQNDLNQESIATSLGYTTDVQYDGKVYVLILVLTILDILINALLIVAIILLACLLNYCKRWLIFISWGYTAVIGIVALFFWIKLKKAKKNNIKAKKK